MSTKPMLWLLFPWPKEHQYLQLFKQFNMTKNTNLKNQLIMYF